MSTSHVKRYFVGQVDEHSYRPSPEAEFEIQIPGPDDPAERCAYIGRHSNAVIALVEFTLQGPRLLPIEGHGVPLAVIEAARKREAGLGEYVNERGEIVEPAFLAPDSQ